MYKFIKLVFPPFGLGALIWKNLGVMLICLRRSCRLPSNLVPFGSHITFKIWHKIRKNVFFIAALPGHCASDFQYFILHYLSYNMACTLPITSTDIPGPGFWILKNGNQECRRRQPTIRNRSIWRTRTSIWSTQNPDFEFSHETLNSRQIWSETSKHWY